MKKTRKVKRTTEHTEVLERLCDLCGKKATEPGRDWAEEYYEKNEVEVEVRVRAERGDVFPEGGDTKATEFDICPDCFHGKLVPWMKSQGAEPRTVEHDF